MTRGARSWLLIENVGRAGDTRPVVRSVFGRDGGLHAADVAIALQQLVELVVAQGAAWKASH